MNSARYVHFKADPQPPSNPPVRQSSQKSQVTKTPVSTTSTSKQLLSTNPAASTVRCFNCSSYGHFAVSCPKPKREPVPVSSVAQHHIGFEDALQLLPTTRKL